MEWKRDRQHPRYDGNKSDCGLPKGIAALYEKNKKIIEFWTSQYTVTSATVNGYEIKLNESFHRYVVSHPEAGIIAMFGTEQFDKVVQYCKER